VSHASERRAHLRFEVACPLVVRDTGGPAIAFSFAHPPALRLEQ
jgi:hypothetical protein